VEGVRVLIKGNQKKIFILGAGSSVHINGPLNKDWAERIIKNETNLHSNGDAVSFLKNNPGFNNIESLLTLIDLSIETKHNFLPLSSSLDFLFKLREQLSSCIIKVADEITKQAQKDMQLKKFFDNEGLAQDDTIINFNYDLLCDNALHKTGLWNPYKGIRTEISGYGFGLVEKFNGDNLSQVQYLKLHGSINFRNYEGLVGLDWNLFDPDNKSKTVEVSKFTHSIITPSFMKTFELMPLRMMWISAQKSIAKAEKIYIVGYSFPKADALARNLLLNANFETLQKIIIIDPLTTDFSELENKKIEKANDTISMLPWQKDDGWKEKIEIVSEGLKDYLVRK